MGCVAQAVYVSVMWAVLVLLGKKQAQSLSLTYPLSTSTTHLSPSTVFHHSNIQFFSASLSQPYSFPPTSAVSRSSHNDLLQVSVNQVTSLPCLKLFNGFLSNLE